MKTSPMRRCVGCRTMFAQSQLIRIVCSAGAISIDTAGKGPGRGAYLCKNPLCLAAARKSKGLERAFKQAVPPDVYDRLQCGE